MLAIVRPDSMWEVALLFHVLGALALIGGVALVSAASVGALRTPTLERALALRRVALRGMLLVVIPAFVIMRLAAEWVRSADPFPDDLAWVELGYVISDFGVIVLVALAVLAWLAVRATGRGGRAPVTGQIQAVLAPLYLVALLVAVWAMTTKPT
jgi:hypothetical protein